MKWIPIEEKMPDMPPDSEGFPKSGAVLIYCTDGYMGTAHAAIYDDKAEWYSDDDYPNNDVTHWMPLPAPPRSNPHGRGCSLPWGTDALLKACTAQPERQPMTDDKKRTLVNTWFAEGWAQKAAFGMLEDYETFSGIGKP